MIMAHMDLDLVSTNKEAEAQAEAFKKEANSRFSDQDYEAAISLYSKAITLYPTPTLYANRALAYIRTESFGYAERDANDALQLDPNCVKAYYRRATANMSMMKFKEALKDLKMLMKCVPNDLDARKKFDECQKIVRRIEFEKVIAVEDTGSKNTLDALGDVDSMVVDENYTGPHLPKTGSTPEFAIELMKHFRNEKALHKKYAYM
ncbi:Serine/threonine-protein phosphatase 5, partial [Coelomomyces lativittatus]